MKAIRTRNFYRALRAVSAFSAIFLLWLWVFGRKLAYHYFEGVADSVFAVLVLATVSFLAFCFLPYFKGDRRWFSIPAILTVVFFTGLVVLWQVPTAVVI